ncbi:MAG: hypothetical protein RIS26_794 [Actinomycetota bacterium]|jgi:deoxyribodipyrimidine photo-lyase
MKSLFWFRKDLRTEDHPALNAALKDGSGCYLVATADQVGQRFEFLSEIRKRSMVSSWYALNESLDGNLIVLQSPADMVRFSKENEVARVFVSEVFDTHGVSELAAVKKDLAAIGIELVVGPGNYAISPGTVRKPDGSPYKVYTPFYKAWDLMDSGEPVKFVGIQNIAAGKEKSFLPLTKTLIAGENQALGTLKRFLESRVHDYSENRNRADLSGTSHLSHAISHGEIHPRTILRMLPDGSGAETFRKEIAWREFYADVMWHRLDTLEEYFDPKFAMMRYDEPGNHFEAWKLGKTGYPMVDAGMRQLLTTGWMHNRVRMIVASFLVKDLHIEWQHGARWFEQNLTDYDPASNSHGWQWTAGCGTDASPYYRIFNPTTQGLKFDPEGNYVRKFIPELASVQGGQVHEPWLLPGFSDTGYCQRIVDHATERNESLLRLEELKQN